jgi:hypothetical protein
MPLAGLPLIRMRAVVDVGRHLRDQVTHGVGAVSGHALFIELGLGMQALHELAIVAVDDDFVERDVAFF